MRPISELRERLRARVWRGREEREMEAELAFHLEMQTAENERRGMTPAEARRQALIAFGGVQQVREEVRDARSFGAVEDAVRDVRHAARRLARAPGFTAVAVLSLALGIGASAAIFSLFHQALLRPLPVAEPERLVNVGAPGPKPGSVSCGLAGDCDAVFSYPMFRDLERAPGALSGIAAHRIFGANLALGDRTMPGDGVFVSGGYFPLLGVRPALGRLLGPDDDGVPGGHPVAVLSHRFWQAQLGGDAGVLGRQIVVNGSSLTVVGVAPAGFDGTSFGHQPAVFVPLVMRGVLSPAVTDAGFDNRQSYWLYLFGRLAPGATPEAAREALNAVYRPIIRDLEAPQQGGMGEATLARFRERAATLEPGWQGQSVLHGEARLPLTLVLGITGLVLLITCANIAGLLLARDAARRHEMAVRGSLGAGRARLLRQLLTESALLALLGGAASMVVARWTLSVVGSFLPTDIGGIFRLELHTPVFVFAAAVSLGTGLLVGAYPALHATRIDLAGALKSNAARSTGSRASARFRTLLVTAQVALSMALLVAAGLFVRSTQNIGRVELGLRPEGVTTFELSPALNGYTPDAARDLFGRVEAELAALPGAAGVSSASVAVLRGDNWGESVSVEGFVADADTNVEAQYNQVGADYFRTLGVPLLAGREFSAADDLGAPRVAVVNRAFARKFGLDEQTAVGKRIALGRDRADLDVEIVGLVEDTRYSHVKVEMPPLLFTPWRQASRVPGLSFYVREAGGATAGAAVHDVVRRLDAALPVQNLMTLEQQVREDVFLDRMITTLSTAFALLATLLAAIGLYGVVASSVAQRTREIGVRMALGAGSGQVRRMVFAQVGRIAAVGVAGGVVAALALGAAARSLLFGVGGVEPAVVAAAALVLAAVALGAAYLPARRATRADPMVVLRAE